MSEARYFVVIPAYNEGATIRRVVEKTLHNIEHVVVVDDGSVDGTAAQLADLPVTVLRNTYNCGKAATLMRGCLYALAQGATGIITLDGDEQHDADDIPKLIEMHEQHPHNLIIGARLANTAEAPAHRLFANRLADFWVSWAARHRVYDSQSGFRLYPAALMRTIKAAHGKYWSFVFESEIIINAARKDYFTMPVAIKSCYPEQRRASHYRPWRDISKTVLMISWKLASRGFDIPGLIKSLKSKAY
jgi:glycosyltransferase involved in cell wall biosynthesis